MDKKGSIVGNVGGERDSATSEMLQACDPAAPFAVLDNLHAMPVSDEEIAAVEDFLGLQAAMILEEDKRLRNKAI